jgi:hypothetical protein
VVVHYGKVDKSSYNYARDMALDMVGVAEPRGVVLTDTDNAYFPPRYLQVVEGVRTDVRVVNPKSSRVPGYLATDLLDRYSAGYFPSSPDSEFVQMVEKNYRDTAIYAAYFGTMKPGWESVWLGDVVRLLPKGATPAKTVRPRVSYPASVASDPDLDSDGREAVLMPEVMKAMILYDRGDFSGASSIFSVVIPRFQKNLYVPTLYSCSTFSQLYEYWGRSMNALGNFKDTVSFLPQARKIDPDFVSLTLAWAYENTGDERSALNELDRYLDYYPGTAEALEEKGCVLFALGKYKQAADELSRAADLSALDQRPKYIYGRALLEAGRRQEALAQFRAVVTMDPSTEWARLSEAQLK